MGDHVPEHKRSTPEEWPDLMVAAQSAQFTAGSGVSYSMEKLHALDGTISALSDGALEANLHYAQGEAICHLVRLIRQQNIRQRIVRVGVNILFDESVAQGSLFDALDEPSLLSPAFKPEVEQSYNLLGSDVRLTGNLLGIARSYRRYKPGSTTHERMEQLFTEPRPHLLRLLETPVTTAGGLFLNKLMRARSPETATHPDTATRASLRHASVQQVAQKCCGITIADILDDKDYVAVQGDGVEFLGSQVSPTEQTRSACPAVFVPGAVSEVLDVLTTVVEQTSKMLDTRFPA